MDDATSIDHLTALLSTSHFPDVEEAQTMRSRLRTRAERIDALGTKIQELCAQRSLLRQACTIDQALLAPIRKLPAETLGEIFVHCIPPVYSRQFTTRPWRAVRGKGECDIEAHPAFMRQCLAQVCRRWRNVARDTPRLWTDIMLDHALPEDLSVVRALLQNSGSCPLDVYIFPHAWKCTPEHSRALLRLLRGEVRRFRCFFADMHSTYPVRLLGKLFPSGTFTDMSNLEVFGVRTESDEGMGAIIAPKLEILDLWRGISPFGSFTTDSLPSLRQLRLKLQQGCSSATYTPLLENVPQLEALHLEYHTSWTDDDRPPRSVTLRSLKDLTMVSLDPVDAQKLTLSLHVPALETLYIDLRGLDYMDGASISWLFDQDHLAGAATSLQHLTVANVDFLGNDVGKWLSKLVNIRTLRITAPSVLEAAFFTILTPTPCTPSEGWACPKLEDLALCHVSVVGDDLVRLFWTRTQPDGEAPRPGYLKAFEVSQCFGMESHHLEELRRANRSVLQLEDLANPEGWGW